MLLPQVGRTEDKMLKNVTVSFPGLGLGEWDISNVAFTLPFGEGGFPVYWYGVIIACGMLLALAYAAYRCRQYGISLDDLTDITIFTILLGVVGARLYYVIFSDHSFSTFMDIIDIRSGGLAIYGGIIAGALTIFVCCRIKKISWRKLFDCVAPGIMLAQAIGRWGNFCNGEAYGSLVSESHPLYFMRMGLCSDNTMREFMTARGELVYVHPTFLYESMWNILGFVLINIVFKKKKFDGQNALYYFAWYGFGRMFIEGLRTDALFIGSTGIRVSQLLGFLLFAVATALVVYGLIYVKNHGSTVSLPVTANSAPVPEAEETAETAETAETEENTDNGNNENG